MNLQVTVEAVSFHTDARGWVVEPVDERQLAGQRNVHVVLTQPGGIRGNHLHRHTTEVLLVMGPALVRWREGETIHERQVAEAEALRFMFPPGIPHAIQNTGPRPGVLASFNDRPHDRSNPDTMREVLIED